MLNFAARVPGAASYTDIGSIFAYTRDASSVIQFLTRTGMTNGNSGTGAIIKTRNGLVKAGRLVLLHRIWKK